MPKRKRTTERAKRPGPGNRTSRTEAPVEDPTHGNPNYKQKPPRRHRGPSTSRTVPGTGRPSKGRSKN